MARLEELIASVLSVAAGSLTDSDGPETIESWDSLNHVLLAGVIEEEFEVTLSANELMAAKTVGDFRNLLRLRGLEV